MVGAGHLGTALSMYDGFKQRGFKIVGIFDTNSEKIGKLVNGVEIYPLERIEDIAKASEAQIGIIAVPASDAQEVADILIKANLKAILNFAPRVLNVPNDIEVRNVDLSVNLEILTFNLGMKRSSR